MRRQIKLRVMNPLLETFGLPEYKTPGSAAVDLVACIETQVVLSPSKNVLIPTGIAVSMHDSNLVAVVVSRSGLTLNKQVRVGQGLGIVDSDYHGEIAVILQNDSADPYTIEPGERIAQLMFMPVVQVAFEIVEEFVTETDRGNGGFGSSGKF